MNKPRHTGVWLSLIVGALSLAIALLVLSRRTAALSGQVERAAKLEAENKNLQTRSERMAQDLDLLRAQVALLSAAPEGPAARPGRPELPPGTLEAVRNLGRLRDNLTAANNQIEQLKNQIAELDAALEKLKEDNQRLTARQSELSENLAGSNRLAEALQSELKGKGDRLAPLEINNRALLKENRESAEKIERITRLTAELEEINRRRDAYLTSILRRYREVTDQYRALAARQDNPGDRPLGSADVTRIQNAVSISEDDLRQLQGLNAQAQSLQRKIRGN